MLDFCKQVLLKVSFDPHLFKKELAKMIALLKKDEALLLKVWCLATFGAQYKDIIQDVFLHT